MYYRKINRLFITLALTAFLGLTVSCSSSDSGDSSDTNSDTDGDGVPDLNDAFPNDSTETLDTDGDGIGDNADLDDDADGLPDDNDENPLDTDNDGLPNSEDDDDDDDGVPDSDDAFPLDQSESMDSDGDGIGDNADPDNSTGDPDGDMSGDITAITSGNSPCIINTGADGNATFSGGFMWSNNTDSTDDLEVAYAIQDNNTACGGVGGSLPGVPSASYNLSWQLPVTGDSIINILLTVNSADGSPVAVQNQTDNTVTISSPDLVVGGAGSWTYEGCSLNITSVEASATPMLSIVTGSLSCDADADPAQILTRPIPIPNTPDTSIRFTNPMEFRTVIGLLG